MKAKNMPSVRARRYAFKNFVLEIHYHGGTQTYVSPQLRGYVRAQMTLSWLAGYRAGKKARAK